MSHNLTTEIKNITLMDFIKEYNYLNSIYDHARFPALMIFFLQHLKNENIYGLSSLFTDFLGPWVLGQNFFIC